MQQKNEIKTRSRLGFMLWDTFHDTSLENRPSQKSQYLRNRRKTSLEWSEVHSNPILAHVRKFLDRNSTHMNIRPFKSLLEQTIQYNSHNVMKQRKPYEEATKTCLNRVNRSGLKEKTDSTVSVLRYSIISTPTRKKNRDLHRMKRTQDHVDRESAHI